MKKALEPQRGLTDEDPYEQDEDRATEPTVRQLRRSKGRPPWVKHEEWRETTADADDSVA